MSYRMEIHYIVFDKKNYLVYYKYKLKIKATSHDWDRMNSKY